METHANLLLQVLCLDFLKLLNSSLDVIEPSRVGHLKILTFNSDKFPYTDKFRYIHDMNSQRGSLDLSLSSPILLDFEVCFSRLFPV